MAKAGTEQISDGPEPFLPIAARVVRFLTSSSAANKWTLCRK